MTRRMPNVKIELTSICLTKHTVNDTDLYPRLQKNQWYFLIHSNIIKNKLIFYLVASAVWKVVLKTRRKAVGSYLAQDRKTSVC